MNPFQSYRQNSVQTASNEQVLIMLLEAAINDQVEAVEAMAKQDKAEWINRIHHCRSIFVELMSALDHEAAPAITRNLHLVYAWCLHHLNQAQRTGNVDTIANVHRVTCSLYSTWSEALVTAEAANNAMIAEPLAVIGAK